MQCAAVCGEVQAYKHFFLSFNKQLHVLFDACEYKAAKITKLNKEFLFVVNFELI